MRRYMTFARISLILSIINFARAAPLVVKRVHEVHEVRVNVVDVVVAEDGTTTSQKGWDSGPRDDWLATAADQTSEPTTPRLPDLDHSLRSPTRLNNQPSSSALSTGPHPRSKDGSPLPSSLIPSVPDQSFTSSPDFSWASRLSSNSLPPSPDYSLPSSTDNPHPSSPDFSWASRLSADSLPLTPDYSQPSSTDNSHPSSPDFSWASRLSADSLPLLPAKLDRQHPPVKPRFLLGEPVVGQLPPTNPRLLPVKLDRQPPPTKPRFLLAEPIVGRLPPTNPRLLPAKLDRQPPPRQAQISLRAGCWSTPSHQPQTTPCQAQQTS
jgi:hypothetical protein